jgi:L-fucose isomerase
VSLVEILRRVDFGIYDKEEFEKAMQWVEKYCKPQEGHD